MATQIQLQDLTKRFDSTTGKSGAGGGTLAVDRVTLTIQPGELFFLLGPSGCGKTTLLRMIAGFIEPTSGQILFKTSDGSERDVTFLPPNKRNTGMVFQSYALWPHMTVAQNVGFGLDIRSVGAQEKQNRINEALAIVQMDAYAARKPNQLSGGQQQRVALARALVIKPDVLLLDEPLSNLDAKLRNELRSEIRRICKDAGITGVYVTHDQKEALSMADRVAVLNAGRIVQVDEPARMYRRPRNKFVAEFLGETNLFPARIVDRAGDSHVIVETKVGRLIAAGVSKDVDVERALDAAAPDADGGVLVSVRPEAVRIGTPNGTNTMFAKVRESTYLGETAQLIAEVGPGGEGGSGRDLPALKVALLNPGLGAAPGQALTLAVDPDDVVVLPRGRT
ncbi:MAG: ABC transporter ATP-binding protein [Phycisphaeraceae bacterium]|nr:ABC transporter ATP-binding protein [Phycisphaeraceae bacterium]